MIIEQSKSIGKTLDNLSNKQCKVFLFNTDIPANNAMIPFDPTDPLAMYSACSAVLETQYSYNENTGVITFKGVPENTGIHFKGHGPDVTRSGKVHNVVPLSISTDMDMPNNSRFDILNIMNTNVDANWSNGTQIRTGHYIEFVFEEMSQLDGLDYRFNSANTFADFSVKYYDETLNDGAGDWVIVYSTADRTYQDRVTFDSPINASVVRIEFDVDSISPINAQRIQFFSNKLDYVNTVRSDVQWAMILFDVQGTSAISAVGTDFPYIWMNVGSALSPSEMILAKVSHQPAQPARLVHCEIVADEVEDV